LFLLAKPAQQQPPKISPAVQRPPPPVRHATTNISDQNQGVHGNGNVRLQQEVSYDFLKRIFIDIN
jgi:hypothetical protein